MNTHLYTPQKEVVEEYPDCEVDEQRGEHGESKEVLHGEGDEDAQIEALNHRLKEGCHDCEHVESQTEPSDHARSVDLQVGVGHILLGWECREDNLVAAARRN